MINKFIKLNQNTSYLFDRVFLNNKYSVDGLLDFETEIAPKLIKKNYTIYDVGGGKIPFVNLKQKNTLNLKIIGVDIDEAELNQAPKNSYDKIVVSDIAEYNPKKPEANLVICKAVLEHVNDTSSAITAITKCLKKEGKAALFIPCKNSIFAHLNTLLPENIKKQILYRVFPQTQHAQGFPAYYNMCTPKKILALCADNGLEVELLKPYYFVSYFSFFFPIHFFWRLSQLIINPFMPIQYSESFTVIAVKK